jgi:hypothetical protein
MVQSPWTGKAFSREGWRCFHCGVMIWKQSDRDYMAGLIKALPRTSLRPWKMAFRAPCIGDYEAFPARGLDRFLGRPKKLLADVASAFWEAIVFIGENGGRYRDRTYDHYDVNVLVSRETIEKQQEKIRENPKNTLKSDSFLGISWDKAE